MSKTQRRPQRSKRLRLDRFPASERFIMIYNLNQGRNTDRSV